MFFSIVSSVALGGLVVYSHLTKTGNINDATKIQRIAKNCGLFIKEGKEERTIQLYRRHKNKWGTEYVYRIPLGLSFKDFEKKIDQFQDGINNKKNIIDIYDLKYLNFRKKIVPQIKQMANKKLSKEVTMNYDGMLKINIYNQPLTKELKFDRTMLEKCKGWEVPVGASKSGLVKHNFEKRPHMIVAGATGFGKSEYIKLVVTVLAHNKNENVRFHLIDLKGGTELGPFRNLKQTLKFGRSPKEAKIILEEIQKEMNKKLDLLFEKGLNNVSKLGQKYRDFVIIDEAADIADDKKCVELITDISRRGRSAGYRLIYATQYPTNETLPSQVRANIGARICYRLETNIQSRAVLDEGGAEELPEIEGRAIFRRVSNQIVQTPYIEKADIDELINPHMRREKIEPRERKKARANTLVIEET
jgi:energy-coupling factor transporter ATP-binding protein EcfA2